MAIEAIDRDYGNVKIIFDKTGRGNRYNLVISDAKILFKNFTGAEKVFNGSIINEKGQRNFCVIIDNPELEDWLVSEGWNIKHTRGTEDYPSEAYIQVKVAFGKFPPVIKRHVGHITASLDEDTVCQLDTDIIVMADIVVNPSHWSSMGREGVAAYLRSAHFTVEDSDPFASKYVTDHIEDELGDIPFE